MARISISKREFLDGGEAAYTGLDGRKYFMRIEDTGMFGWQKVVFRDGLGRKVDQRTGLDIAGGLYDQIKATPERAPRTGAKMKRAPQRSGYTVKRMRKKGVKRTKRGSAADRKRNAMPAGKRVSGTGRKYTERRANRAD